MTMKVSSEPQPTEAEAVQRDDVLPVRNREGGDVSVPHQEHVCLLYKGKDK